MPVVVLKGVGNLGRQAKWPLIAGTVVYAKHMFTC